MSLKRTRQFVEAGITAGLHIGAQLSVSVGGRSVEDWATGDAKPGVPMTSDSIALWLSAGKPLAAVAIARLWEAGRLELDDPVARHVPEFGTRGKERITIRHLLTHTGGIRWADFTPAMAWEEIIARLCAAPREPRWVLGKSAGYHAMTSWYLLGEIVRRLDARQRPYAQVVREDIFLPLGMNDCWFALSPGQVEAYGDRLSLLPTTGSGHGRPFRFDEPAHAAQCSPGASGRGPMRELAKFYEMLLRRGRSESGVPILLPQTVEALTARHRTGLVDQTFRQKVDWGLGFVVNSAIYGEATVPYGFGPFASPRTFGHGGSQSSIGFADPEHLLVVALLFNGMPGELEHHQRMRQALAAIYEDLGLASAADDSGERA